MAFLTRRKILNGGAILFFPVDFHIHRTEPMK